jgi:ABC-type siderophore export system fused ATPase/permease subunit
MMDTLLGILKGVAPVLATAIAGPAGGAAVGWLASKLGIPDETIEGVTAALQGNPELTMKLKELDLEYAKLEVADRDSARKAYAEVATSENATRLEKAVVPILALGVVGLAFLLIGVLMFVNTPGDQQQIIIFALGFITSAAGQVLSFYFGSSQGSKDKTKEIESLMKK